MNIEHSPKQIQILPTSGEGQTRDLDLDIKLGQPPGLGGLLTSILYCMTPHFSFNVTFH